MLRYFQICFILMWHQNILIIMWYIIMWNIIVKNDQQIIYSNIAT